MARIEVDREACIGSGLCAWNAPEVFAQDEDGLSRVLPGAGHDPDEDAVDEALSACPGPASPRPDTSGPQARPRAVRPRPAARQPSPAFADPSAGRVTRVAGRPVRQSGNQGALHRPELAFRPLKGYG